MSDENERVLYSRSAVANPLGKCTSEVKVPLDDETNDTLAFLAGAHGLTKSEYIRRTLQEHCFGHATMLRHYAGIGMAGKGR